MKAMKHGRGNQQAGVGFPFYPQSSNELNQRLKHFQRVGQWCRCLLILALVWGGGAKLVDRKKFKKKTDLCHEVQLSLKLTLRLYLPNTEITAVLGLRVFCFDF